MGSRKDLIAVRPEDARRDPLMGATIRKSFGSKFYLGRVVGIDSDATTGERAYHVHYEDSDEEHLSAGEIQQALVSHALAAQSQAWLEPSRRVSAMSRAPTPRTSLIGGQLQSDRLAHPNVEMNFKSAAGFMPLLVALAAVLVTVFILPTCWSCTLGSLWSDEDQFDTSHDFQDFSVPSWSQEEPKSAAALGDPSFQQFAAEPSFETAESSAPPASSLEPPTPEWMKDSMLPPSGNKEPEVIVEEEPNISAPVSEVESSPPAESKDPREKDIEEMEIAMQALAQSLKVIGSGCIKVATSALMSIATPLIGGDTTDFTVRATEEENYFETAAEHQDSSTFSVLWSSMDPATLLIVVVGALSPLVLSMMYRRLFGSAQAQAAPRPAPSVVGAADAGDVRPPAVPPSPLRPRMASPVAARGGAPASDVFIPAMAPIYLPPMGQYYILEESGTRCLVKTEGAGAHPGSVWVSRHVCNRQSNRGRMTFRRHDGPAVEVPASQLTHGPFLMKPGGMAPPHIVQLFEETQVKIEEAVGRSPAVLPPMGHVQPPMPSSSSQQGRPLSSERFRFANALERLRAMGFDESEAKRALNHYEGNVRLALDHLMPCR